MPTNVFEWRDLHFDISDPQVYSPKPASIFLAEHAIARIQPGDTVLDIGTGSGIVGIAVTKYVEQTRVILSDINERALACARTNAENNSVSVHTVLSSLCDAFEDQTFDVITAHPPAVPYPDEKDWGMTSGMRIATHGGNDGSDLVVSTIAGAHRCLKPSGKLLLALPCWSHVKRAQEELRKHYTSITDLGKKQISFFPVIEGKPDAALLTHVRNLAKQGIIEMHFDTDIPTSFISIIEATK